MYLIYVGRLLGVFRVLKFDLGILEINVVIILQNNETIINGSDLKIIEWLRLKQSNGVNGARDGGTYKGILESLHTFRYTRV
jgi:hypothetical protein